MSRERECIICRNVFVCASGVRIPRCDKCWLLYNRRIESLRQHQISWDAIRNLITVGAQCWVCRKPVSLMDSSVDHDHRCCIGNKGCKICVRGITHPPCNASVGHIEKWRSELPRLVYFVDDFYNTNIRKGNHAR